MQQQIRKLDVSQRKIKKPLNSLLTLTKSFIDNDPTEKLLNLTAEGNKNLRKQEMEMMKLTFGQLHPITFSNTFSLHSPFSNRNCSRFQQIPYLQNHVTAEEKGHPENKNFFYHILQTPFS